MRRSPDRSRFPAIPNYESVHELFQGYVDADPTYCAQLAVFVGDELVVDLAQGMQLDSCSDSHYPVAWTRGTIELSRRLRRCLR
jgi:hypothetical protein